MLTVYYGKSPLYMGKLTIWTGPFSIAMLTFTRRYDGNKPNNPTRLVNPSPVKMGSNEEEEEVGMSWKYPAGWETQQGRKDFIIGLTNQDSSKVSESHCYISISIYIYIYT